MTRNQDRKSNLVESERTLVLEDPTGTMEHSRISTGWCSLHSLGVRFKWVGIERLGRGHTTLTISKG